MSYGRPYEPEPPGPTSYIHWKVSSWSALPAALRAAHDRSGARSAATASRVSFASGAGPRMSPPAACASGPATLTSVDEPASRATFAVDTALSARVATSAVASRVGSFTTPPPDGGAAPASDGDVTVGRLTKLEPMGVFSHAARPARPRTSVEQIANRMSSV